MSAVTNYYHSNVGRMFARQNVPSLYNVQKNSGNALQEATTDATDKVTLSAQAPKPLTAGLLENAMSVGKSLADNKTLSEADSERLREDRVFAAVSALSMLGYDAETANMGNWPGGLPAPTTAELDAARRRLAQRPQNPEEAGNLESLLQDRQSILQSVGRMDLSSVSLSATG